MIPVRPAPFVTPVSPLQISSLVAARRLDHDPFAHASADVGSAAHPPVDHEAAPPAAPRAPVSSVAYAMATAVLAADDATVDPQAAAKLEAWVPRLVAAGLLSPEEGRALHRALLPLPVQGADPAQSSVARQLAEALASRVADGGAFLERRLAASAQGARRQDDVAGDLRLRLAALASVLTDAPAALAEARDAVRDLQHALLVEQARVAAHFAEDGVLDLRMRLAQPSGVEVPLHLRIGREAPGEDDDVAEDRMPWRRVTLALTLEGLGAVQVQLLATRDGRLQTEFVVAGEDAADRIEADLADLTGALDAAGFAQVLSRVVVDPVRAAAPETLPELPSHAIVDVQA